MDASPDTKWSLGLNSLLDPAELKVGEYPWSVNTDNVGGIMQTRQGFNAIGCKESPIPVGEPKGMAIFKGSDGVTRIYVAAGDSLYSTAFPIVSDFVRIGDGFKANAPVVFCKAIWSVIRKTDGSLVVLQKPIPALIMQNGIERPRYANGVVTAEVPAFVFGTVPGMPVGKWMQWSGNRLWISQGNRLMASDLGDPFVFFEQENVAGGGYFPFDTEITGMTQTSDVQNLLVSTDFDTYSVQSNIFDRTSWGATPGFITNKFPGVGCAAGKSFVRQWGVVWWMSHGGWVGIDQALITYQRSRIQYRDQQMMRAKARLSPDKSGICSGKFGNYLVIGVPYGSKDNTATWVLNQRVIDITSPSALQDLADPAAWASQWTGIQPVEFATAVVDGQERLFALSRTVSLSGQGQATVWEMFTGERQDRYNDSVSHPPCLFETRLLGYTDALKAFHFADIDVSELLGLVNVKAYFAGRKGNYQKIMDKQIVASAGSVNASITSPVVKSLLQDLNEGDTNIVLDSTDGLLPAPSTINIGGRVFNYSAIDGNNLILGDQPPPPIPPPPGHLVAPTMSPPEGTYDTELLVVLISEPVIGSHISYTTDGSDPSRTTGTIVTSNRFILQIAGPADVDVKAMAFLPDDENSDSTISTVHYEVTGSGPPPRVPGQIDQFDLPDLTIPVPFPLLAGTQALQPQFDNSTILTSYMPQRRMLRTEEYDERKYPCNSCGVESPFPDNIDRGFSLLVTWTGRMAITALRIMTRKAPDPMKGRCEADEITSRSLNDVGCGSKSDIIIEVPTVDSGPRQSQYLASITQRNFEDAPYNALPIEIQQ